MVFHDSLIYEITPWSIDLKTFSPWLQKSTKSYLGISILRLSGPGSRSQEKHTLEHWFHDFLALAPEVNKITTWNSDFMTFWPWLQKSIKSHPGTSIWRLSRPGSRSQQNHTLGHWFKDFLVLVPEVNKIMPWGIELKTFWLWLGPLLILHPLMLSILRKWKG